MMGNEAKARIKINKLLESAGWRFEDTDEGPANIQVEAGVKYSELGDDLERAVSRTGQKGALDFLLLDSDKRPLVVLEAKRSNIDPLSAKEQARKYALSIKARFIILSNGDLHYFWDTQFGNPETIINFPSPESITQHRGYQPNPEELATTVVDENYIIATQYPNYDSDPDFQDPKKLAGFLKRNNLKQMRPIKSMLLEPFKRARKKVLSATSLKWQPVQERHLSPRQ
jgi:type I restriction enzyme R subunit